MGGRGSQLNALIFLGEGMCRHCLLEYVHIVTLAVYLVCVVLVTPCIG